MGGASCDSSRGLVLAPGFAVDGGTHHTAAVGDRGRTDRRCGGRLAGAGILRPRRNWCPSCPEHTADFRPGGITVRALQIRGYAAAMSSVRLTTVADWHKSSVAWRRWAVRAAIPVLAVFLLLASLWMAVRITPLAVGDRGRTDRRCGGRRSGAGASPVRARWTCSARRSPPSRVSPARSGLGCGSRTSPRTPNWQQLLGSSDKNSAGVLGRQLSAGWLRYALWEGAVSAGIVVVVLSAVTGLRRYSLAPDGRRARHRGGDDDRRQRRGIRPAGLRHALGSAARALPVRPRRPQRRAIRSPRPTGPRSAECRPW